MGGSRLPFVVDTWRKGSGGAGEDPPLHFLSHIHTDHTLGLDSSWPGPLYCSEVTGRLVVERLQVREELVVPLEVGQAHVLWTASGRSLTVTVIDANHCPGAVMFLFEGSFGAVLHTGDFRFSRLLHREQCPALAGLLARRRLDKLFLDNTYCVPFFSFPPTSEATAEAVALVERLLLAATLERPSPRRLRLVVGLDSVGKEPLLVALALRFGVRVGLANRRLRTVELSGIPLEYFRLSSFSTGESPAEEEESDRLSVANDTAAVENIRMEGGEEAAGGAWNVGRGQSEDRREGRVGLVVEAVDRRWIDAEKVADWNEEMPSFVLLPSVRSHLRHKPSNTFTFTVPYSEHSSYPELIEFVSWLQPREILPIVVQSYRSLKKHLVPHVPGVHLGDLASFRMSNPYSRNQGVSENTRLGHQQATTPFVPTTIDEFQALYPWTANLGQGNKIKPSLYRSSTLGEEDISEALGGRSPTPLRALSSPAMLSCRTAASPTPTGPMKRSRGEAGSAVEQEIENKPSGLESWLQKMRARANGHLQSPEGSQQSPKKQPLPGNSTKDCGESSVHRLASQRREKGSLAPRQLVLRTMEQRHSVLLRRASATPLEGSGEASVHEVRLRQGAPRKKNVDHRSVFGGSTAAARAAVDRAIASQR